MGNEAERRSFHFFRAQTAPQLAGYFISEFWDCLVPLSTHHHPAIKHAVIALASLHERFEKNDNSILSSNYDIAQGGFALQQYNRAIGYLIKPVTDGGQQALDTFLVACILFACYETLRGHYGSAVSHVQNGVKIISSTKETTRRQAAQSSPLVTSTASCVSLEVLTVIFALLDSQSNQLMGGPPMPLEMDPKLAPPGFGPHIPVSFTSLEEAQNSLCYHQNPCLKAVYYLDDTVLQTNPIGNFIEDAYLESFRKSRDVFRNLLKEWASAFEAFLTKAAVTMDTKALQGAAVLKINHRTFTLQIEYHGQNRLESSRCWDFSLRECEEIVDLATTVIKMHNHESRDSPKKPMFCMDMNIVTPLFGIAHRCRDPYIRRRAIALLYSAPRQEGLWHSIITARVAERIMEIEEAGLAEVKTSADIPEENRLSEIDLQPDLQGRKEYLKYSRRQLTRKHIFVAEPVIEILHETIEW